MERENETVLQNRGFSSSLRSLSLRNTFLSRRHIANFAGIQDVELRDLAAVLLQVVQGYNALFDGAMAPMPYLLGLHQLADARFHLHLEILAIVRAPGKLKYAASSELLWRLWKTIPRHYKRHRNCEKQSQKRNFASERAKPSLRKLTLQNVKEPQ